MNSIIDFDKLNAFLGTKDLAATTRSKYAQICMGYSARYYIEKETSISEFMSSPDQHGNETRRYAERWALKYLYDFLGMKTIYDKWAAENKGRFTLKPRKQNRKHVTKEQLRLIINALPMPYSLMARLQYEGGLRSGALFKLQTTDIFKDDNGDTYLTIHEKGNEEFSLYILKNTASALWNIMPKNVQTNQPVFNTYLQAYNRALRKAAIESLKYSISSHWLRTSRVVHLLQADVPFMVVSEIVCRHSKADTTKIYASSAGTDTKKLYKKYGGL